MSKIGLTYLPSTKVWTKISLDKYSNVYTNYLSKKFEQFGGKNPPIFISSWNILWSNLKKKLQCPETKNLKKKQAGAGVLPSLGLARS